jgi:hypothetical protein
LGFGWKLAAGGWQLLGLFHMKWVVIGLIGFAFLIIFALCRAAAAADTVRPEPQKRPAEAA